MPSTESRFLDTARRLLPLPTAPFHEHFVAAEILRFARQRPQLQVEADDSGNLTLTVGDRAAVPHLVLTAHLDHPGLGFARRETARDFLFECLGAVPAQLLRDAPVHIYPPPSAPADAVPAPVEGRVTAYLVDGLTGAAEPRPCCRVRVAGRDGGHVDPGAFATWGLPGFDRDGERLIGRACDDLAGVAVGLTVLDELLDQAGQHPALSVELLLTRAEETGFGGMLAALGADHLDRDAVFVDIECSNCRVGAPLGEGPVVRVGDRRWAFGAGVSLALAEAAEELSARRADFRFQRRLLDGGMCQATALARSGRTVGAVALPLDNYHNNGGAQLAAEAVDLRDAVGLVRLLAQVAGAPGGLSCAVARSVAGLDARLARWRTAQEGRLRETAPLLPRPTPLSAGTPTQGGDR